MLEYIDAEEMRPWGVENRIGRRLAEQIGVDGSQVKTRGTYVVEIEIWHPGTKAKAEELRQEIAAIISGANDTEQGVLDSYVGDSLCLVKVRLKGSMLSVLLDQSAVAEVELPPTPVLDAGAVYRSTTRDYPKPPSPPRDGPRLCILDSGITANHPLLGPYVGHEESILTSITDPSDQNGHGTMVAGVAVYGDVRACFESGQFSSDVTLFSARVLNDQNFFDDEKLIISQMQTAIRRFSASPYYCRVFNLSLGTHTGVLSDSGSRQTQWAESLDVLARTLKVLIVVSAGNRELLTNNSSDAESTLRGYPTELLNGDSGLVDPATSAIALTVGAIAQYSEPSVRTGLKLNDIVRCVAGRDEPAPFTRRGPGINGAIKPELVAPGGNLVFEGVGNTRTIRRDQGCSVMSLSREPTKHLFSFSSGTSFASPYVAHIAAKVFNRLEREFDEAIDPNLVRAILASTAGVPGPTAQLFKKKNLQTSVLKVCGYGVPDQMLALESGDRCVTLVGQHAIQLDHFVIYEVPMFDEMRNAPGGKSITVAIAYDPPVRRRRLEYLGVEMGFQLIRGKTLSEVEQAYGKLQPDEDPEKAFSGSTVVKFEPAGSSRTSGAHRKRSTLQKGIWSFKRENPNYGERYWLAIRCQKRRWVPETVGTQDFGLAVTYFADEPNLYSILRARVEQRARIRR